MALTQARAFGAGTGGRYGSFAGRGAGAHPVDALTQARASGPHTGARYGSFAGKDGSAHPVSRLTQARSFGQQTGRRYGSFAGRTGPGPAPTPSPGPIGRMALPPRLVDELRLRRIEEDDVLLIIAAQIAAGLLH